MHYAIAITTGSANQQSNAPCTRLWIDVIFFGELKIPIKSADNCRLPIIVGSGPDLDICCMPRFDH